MDLILFQRRFKFYSKDAALHDAVMWVIRNIVAAAMVYSLVVSGGFGQQGKVGLKALDFHLISLNNADDGFPFLHPTDGWLLPRIGTSDLGIQELLGGNPAVGDSREINANIISLAARRLKIR